MALSRAEIWKGVLGLVQFVVFDSSWERLEGFDSFILGKGVQH